MQDSFSQPQDQTVPQMPTPQDDQVQQSSQDTPISPPPVLDPVEEYRPPTPPSDQAPVQGTQPPMHDMPLPPQPDENIEQHTESNETAETASSPTAVSEDIADQNIFEMLGVTDGTPEQRDHFLNELQAVIWDDFIEHDTKLLLTEDEQQQLSAILQPDPKSLENQEKAVVFLESLIPDLEEIMLEKALQLKEEMARERLRAMIELHRNDPDKAQMLNRVQQLMEEKQWKSATDLLNSVR